MKKILSMIIMFSLILTLTGCGSADFDASGYVKACLDAAYHEEYEAYAEFIGCTIDEAKADMDEQAQLAVDTELSSLELNVTEEQKEEYLMLLKEIEHLTKYEVGQAGETEEGYIVAVTVYPVDVYEQFLSGINGAYQSAADAGELKDETIFPIMTEFLKKCIDKVQYKEATETVIQVTADTEAVWQISEEEMYAIDDLLLPGI